jgi:hypothetical protein
MTPGVESVKSLSTEESSATRTSTSSDDHARTSNSTDGKPRGFESTNGHRATRESEDKAPRQWAYISDTVVRLTTLEEVLKVRAYMCFYERI